MRKSVLFRLLLIFWGVVLMGMMTAFTDWMHPGCLVVAAPAYAVPEVPGLPCLPTTPAPGPGGTPAAPTGNAGAQQGPIRLTVSNGSELPFSITLIGSQTYILNVRSGETRVFVLERGGYSFNMMLCGLGAQGVMSFSRMTRLTFKSCSLEKLVEVSFANKTAEGAVARLSGPGNFVFSIPAGETRWLTIPRGDYALTYMTCGVEVTGVFEARSHRTLTLTCP